MIDSLPPDTHTVILALGDLSGILRGKRLHVSMWDRACRTGIAMANAIFVLDMTCDIWDTPYANMGTGYPDFVVHPIEGTLRPVPWSEGTVLAIGEAREEDGSPVRVDPRGRLVRVVEKAAVMGYDAKIGTELEFFLLDPETKRPLDTGIQVYGIARGAMFEHVLGPIRNLCTEFGIPIELSNPEYSPGQFEVNIHYASALTAADNAMLFRNAVKEIAADHGLLATFMAKPFSDLSGSGFHVHQSLWFDGRNAFSDGSGHLSDVGRWYLGGLRRHMRELALLGAPNPNSFRRRQPYTFCPTNTTWGGDNRTVGIRAVEGHDEAVRVEQRDGSADANPYLLVAGQLAAGLWGIENEADPGPRTDGDAYAIDDVEAIPATVPEAVEALRGSALAKELLGDELLEIIVGMAEREQAFVAAAVTDVERARYLEAY